MSKIKKGDCVINYCESEGIINIGFVMDEPNDTDEHDLQFFDGGSVSPVSTSDSYAIPEKLGRYLDSLIPFIDED
jgi:hypothetical protein